MHGRASGAGLGRVDRRGHVRHTDDTRRCLRAGGGVEDNMELQIVYMRPEELKPYENNARKHAPEDVEAIKASIRELGGRFPPVAAAEA